MKKGEDKEARVNAPARQKPLTMLWPILEVAAVALGFILITRIVLTKVMGFEGIGELFEEREDVVLVGFLFGVTIQLMIVGLLLAFKQRDVEAAVESLKAKAPVAGWQIALTVAAVDIIFVAGGWLEEPGRMVEFSKFAVVGSLLPAFDGFSQEVIFRGFILLRLRRARMTGWMPIVVSGLAFSLIHLGYGSGGGGSIGAVLGPVFGTFGLGMAWAWAFQMSNYKLRPVLVSHVLVIILLQPWLALTYMGDLAPATDAILRLP